MSDEPQERSLRRRILLALDATTASASLEAAVELAARLRSELVALFLEDEELLRVADYPHSRHVALPSGEYEPVDSGILARQLRRIAHTLEETLHRATRRVGVEVVFHVVRGSVTEAVATAAAEVDLVFVDRYSNTFAQHGFGLAKGGLLEQIARPLLVWRSPSGHLGPVFVVLGRGDDVGRILAASVRLGGGPERDMIVLLDDPDGGVRSEQRAAAVAWLEEYETAASFYRLERGTAADLERAVRELGAELVVVSADGPRGSATLASWLETTERPVFLVR